MKKGVFKDRLNELIDERFNGNKNAFVVAFNDNNDGFHITGSSMHGILKGEREPSFSTVAGIAQFFDVSMDYLCGLSDARTNDDKAISAANYTGLDADAIEALHTLNNESHISYPAYSKFISYLIIDMYDNSELSDFYGKHEERIIRSDAIISSIESMINNSFDRDDKEDIIDTLNNYMVLNEWDFATVQAELDAGDVASASDSFRSIMSFSKEDIRKVFLMNTVQEIYDKRGQYLEWLKTHNKSTPRKNPKNEKPPKRKSISISDDDLPFS